MNCSIRLGLFIFAFSLFGNLNANRAATWQQVGPGGGGRLMATATVPGTAILFSGSDMGSSYRSADGGRSWSMLPWDSFGAINKAGDRGAWAVDLRNPLHIWAGTTIGLLRSFDGGKTWQRLPGPWDNTVRVDWRLPSRGPHVIVLSPLREGVVLAAFNAYQDALHRKVFLSRDDGQQWHPLNGVPAGAQEDVLCIAFNDAATNRGIVLVTNQAVYQSGDDGQSWKTLERPFDEIHHACCGYRFPAMAPVLYVNAVARSRADGKNGTGMYRSDDFGRTWTPVGEKGLSDWLQLAGGGVFAHITACQTNGDRVYVAAQAQDTTAAPAVTVFRSDDAGDSWRSVLVQEADAAGYNIVGDSWTLHEWGLRQRLSGLSVDAVTPDRLMATNSTSCYLSDDGGRTWRPVHSPPMVHDATPSGGLLVMSAWAYRFDPQVAERHYIPMTDFGGWLSHDAGQTWARQVAGNRWHQNIYDVAFDTRTPGRMWAAGSSVHDIPFYPYRNRMLSAPGGVCRSEDGGLTWREVGVGQGLPSAAMMDLCFVFGSGDAQPDRLFVATMGKGLFVSTNGGVSWAACNEGIDPTNLAMLRIEQGPDGRLFALNTVRQRGRGKSEPGALYASDALGEHWKPLFRRADTPYLLNMDVASGDSQTIAIAALDSELGRDDGGIWLSSDGGNSWRRSITGSFWAVRFSPNKRDRIYAANFGHGLMVSDDRGASWWSATSLPAWRPTGVFFNPEEPDEMYVTAFGGGVWKTNERGLVRKNERRTIGGTTD